MDPNELVDENCPVCIGTRDGGICLNCIHGINGDKVREAMQ